MIAGLSMYEREETRSALQRLWANTAEQLVAAGFADVPTTLTPAAIGKSAWLNKQLVLGQTCGLPYRAALHNHVKIVGAPDHCFDHCAPGYYFSAIVVREDDPRSTLSEYSNSDIICNEVISQSGYATLKHHWQLAGLPWPDNITFSGSHRASAEAVANAQADIAALDITTFKLIDRYDRFAEKLRVLEFTAPTPALPYICAEHYDSETVRKALQRGITTLSEDDQNTLGVFNVVELPSNDYLQIATPVESGDGCKALFLDS